MCYHRVVPALSNCGVDLPHRQSIMFFQDLPQYRLKLLLLGEQCLQEGDDLLLAPVDLVMVVVGQQAHGPGTSHGLAFA